MDFGYNNPLRFGDNNMDMTEDDPIVPDLPVDHG